MMDYITGTHLINIIYKHSVNLPIYLINLLLFLTRQEKRVIGKHFIFKK